jgi:hypothetical protein
MLFVFTIHYIALHQFISEPNNFSAMARRGRNGGNIYASLGVVQKRKKTTHEERLTAWEQCMEEQLGSIL